MQNSRSGLLCLIAVFLFVGSCTKEPKHHGVTFEVGIDRDGRTQPVAGETFRLMRGNLIDLLGGNSKDPNGTDRLSDVTATLPGSSDPEARERMGQVFQKNVVALVQTDTQGKARFPLVLKGTFHIIGWTRVGTNQLMIWNYPVEVKEEQEGEQHVVLTSANAAATVSYTTPAQR